MFWKLFKKKPIDLTKGGIVKGNFTWIERDYPEAVFPLDKLKAFLKKKRMKIDVTLSNGKFYDIPQKCDILLGETFTVTTDGDGTETITSDHDAVLEIVESGPNVKCIAKTLGTSTLRWLNTNDQLIDKISITVFQPANDLGLTASPPVSK